MIEVRRKVKSVIQPVEMVKIRLVEKRVSPTGPRANKKKKNENEIKAISGRSKSGNREMARFNSHGIDESAKYEECSAADQRESCRLRVDKDIDPSDHSREHVWRPGLLLAAAVLAF